MNFTLDPWTKSVFPDGKFAVRVFCGIYHFKNFFLFPYEIIFSILPHEIRGKIFLCYIDFQEFFLPSFINFSILPYEEGKKTSLLNFFILPHELFILPQELFYPPSWTFLPSLMNLFILPLELFCPPSWNFYNPHEIYFLILFMKVFHLNQQKIHYS